MVIISIVLDIVLIGLLIAGIRYAMRLTQQLADMRSSRAEMERFVFTFNATVERAEAGIRGLKSAARSSGDDLEGLIEKGQALRDELHFLTESADQIANRLTNMAGKAAKNAEPPVAEEVRPKPSSVSTEISGPVGAPSLEGAKNMSVSTAERDLMRALGKTG